MPTLRIAITTGEPAGIGPDLTLQLAQERCRHERVVIADPALLQERAARLGLPLQLKTFSANERAQPGRAGELTVLPVTLAAPCRPGQLNTANAPYVLETLRRAVHGCEAQHWQALVTAPVQKSVLNDAGVAFTGHTEFLAQQTRTPQVVMLLACEQMRVALATTHLPLAQVPAAITRERLEQVLRILQRELRSRFRLPQPTIAVLGLNPHAGESGHLGHEERDIIGPTIARLQSEGMQLQGPLPADTAFSRKVLRHCDAVLAMYHDQGLPVLKYAGFGRAVNITLGLPIIRTSVDHGTALDLAGSGQADCASLRYALDCAIDMALAAASAP